MNTEKDNEVLEIRLLTCIRCLKPTIIYLYRRRPRDSYDCPHCSQYYWWDSVKEVLTHPNAKDYPDPLPKENFRMVPLGD